MNTKTTTMKTETRINVAPSSTEGHFVKRAKQVIKLDEMNETFLVKGASVLESKNHTDLELSEKCLITCQVVYDSFTEMYKKSRD